MWIALIVMIQQTGSSNHTSQLKRWPIGISWMCSISLHKLHPFSGLINHQSIFPQDWMVVVPCMLFNGRLFNFSLPSCIHMLLNPDHQSPLCLFNTFYYSSKEFYTQLMRWSFILDPGNHRDFKVVPDLKMCHFPRTCLMPLQTHRGWYFSMSLSSLLHVPGVSFKAEWMKCIFSNNGYIHSFGFKGVTGRGKGEDKEMKENRENKSPYLLAPM